MQLFPTQRLGAFSLRLTSVLALLFSISSSLYAQPNCPPPPTLSNVVISEFTAGGMVELYNGTGATVDVSSYWLCNFPAYQQLSDLTTVSGSLQLANGATVVLSGFPYATNDGELGLYNARDFGNSAAIVSYAEWGSGNHQRSSVAVAAGIWSVGASLPALTTGNSPQASTTAAGMISYAAATENLGQVNATFGIPAPNGGSLTLRSGSIDTTTCVDGQPDDIVVLRDGTATGTTRSFVITSQAGQILALPNGTGPFNLDGAGVGICEIWYLAYEPGLMGLSMGSNIANLQGCYDFSNPITVNRQAPDGGTVTLLSGATDTTVVVGNASFQVTHTTVADALSYWYIITDDNNIILDWVNAANSNTLNLSGAPAGTCRIWGWSYRGLPNPVVGENISTLNDDACEDISDAWISVLRQAPGCDIVTNDINLPSGSTDTVICVDGVADPLMVTTNGGTGTNDATGWIITNDAGEILARPMAPPFDLDGAGVGICEIWYVRYQMADFAGATVGNNLTDITGCFDLSNPITVNRQAPDGGTVTLLSGATDTTVVVGNASFQVTHTTVADALSYWYIITDDNNIILDWVNAANSNTLNLSGAPAGTCRIWGWSYRGLPNPVVGENISTLNDDSCEDISDAWISVLREAPNCDIVTNDISLTSGSIDTVICVDGVADPLIVTTNGGTGNNDATGWIITNDAGEILARPMAPPFDLDGAGVGICEIWYVRYQMADFDGATVGNNLTDITGCFDLSNPITVNRQAPDGGTVTLLSGATDTTVVVGNASFQVTHTTVADALSYWYIITDDNNIILDWVNAANSNTLNLSGAPEGTCRIWGWSYRGLPNPVVGENISTLNDDSCEDISDAWISVLREASSSTTDLSSIAEVSVFPNPTTDFIQIKVGASENTGLLIRLVDATGRVLLSRQAPGATASIALDIRAFPSGNYAVQLIREDAISVKPIVKR